jgi:Protein of unknown function (DUF2971)
MNADQLLSHYTDAAGLEGITGSGCLWCTGIRHLNDRSEFHYVHDVANEMLEAAAKASENDELQLWKELRLGMMRSAGPFNAAEIKAVGAYYLASFSDRHDDLNQYRVYGGQSPYELRFSKEMLQRLADANGFHLIQCDYSMENLRARVGSYMEDAKQLLGKLNFNRSSAAEFASGPLYVALSAFWTAIASIAPQFKHPAYKDEQEWRLVSKYKGTLQHDEAVGFRVKAGRLTPYLIFPLQHALCADLTGPLGKPLVLREVRLGPSNEQAIGLAATVHLIESRGYQGTGVSASMVPHRA